MHDEVSICFDVDYLPIRCLTSGLDYLPIRCLKSPPTPLDYLHSRCPWVPGICCNLDYLTIRCLKF